MSEPVDGRARIGLVVVTHGRLAEELVASMQKIVGEIGNPVEAISIDWNDDVDEAARRIRQAVGRLQCGAGVLLVTDMFGGTPANLALALHEAEQVEIVTGVNLPMLVKFANLIPGTALVHAATLVADQGRESIQVASTLLGSGRHGTESG